MTIHAIIEKLEDAPEALRDSYTKRESDGKFVLKLEGAEDAYAAGIKRNRDEVMDNYQKVKRELAKYEGIDPEKVRQLEKEAAKLAEEQQRKAGDFDSLKAQLVEQHKKELEKQTATLTQREAFIHKLLAENAATEALGAANVKSTKLMLPHVLQHVTVEASDDGEFRAVVKDAKGNPRIKNGNGDPFTIEDLVAEMRELPDYADAFKGTGSSGGGAAGGTRGTQSGGASAVRSRKDLKTDADKASFIKEHGFEAWSKLPTE